MDDQFVTRENKQQILNPQLEQQQQESAYKTEYRSHEVFNAALQGNTYKGTDSDQMKRIKRSMTKIGEQLGAEIATEARDFSEQLRTLATEYDELIEACNDYLYNHHAFFGPAWSRKKLVKNVLALAKAERRTCSDPTELFVMHKGRVDGMVLGNILGERLTQGKAVNLTGARAVRHRYTINRETGNGRTDRFLLNDKPDTISREDKSMVAASRLAGFFDMGEQVRGANLAMVKNDHGKKFFGVCLRGKTRQDAPPAKSLALLKKELTPNKKLRFTPEAIRQLNGLSLLNTLMGGTETDFAEHILLEHEWKHIDGKQIFYIHSCYLAENTKLFSEKVNARTLRNGKGNLPPMQSIDLSLIDKETTDKIAAMQPEDAKYLFGDIFDAAQLAAFNERLTFMQDLIRAKRMNDEQAFWTKEMWNDKDNLQRIREMVTGGHRGVLSSVFDANTKVVRDPAVVQLEEEENRRRLQEEENRRRLEEENRRRLEEENRRRLEEAEKQRKLEEARKKKQEEDDLKLALKLQQEEEQRKKDEEQRRNDEEEKRRLEEEKKNLNKDDDDDKFNIFDDDEELPQNIICEEKIPKDVIIQNEIIEEEDAPFEEEEQETAENHKKREEQRNRRDREEREADEQEEEDTAYEREEEEEQRQRTRERFFERLKEEEAEAKKKRQQDEKLADENFVFASKLRAEDEIDAHFEEIHKKYKELIKLLEQKKIDDNEAEKRLNEIRALEQKSQTILKEIQNGKYVDMDNKASYENNKGYKKFHKQLPNVFRRQKEVKTTYSEVIRQLRFKAGKEGQALFNEAKSMYSNMKFARYDTLSPAFEKLLKIRIKPKESFRGDLTGGHTTVYEENNDEIDKLIQKIRPEELSQNDFERLKRVNPFAAHKLYIKYVTKNAGKAGVKTADQNAKRLLLSKGEMQILQGEQPEYAKVIYENKNYTVYPNPKNADPYNGVKQQGNNYQALMGSCTIASSANCINQLYGMEIVNENKAVEIADSLKLSINHKLYHIDKNGDYNNDPETAEGYLPYNDSRVSGCLKEGPMKQFFMAFNLKATTVNPRPENNGSEIVDQLKAGNGVLALLNADVLWGKKKPSELKGDYTNHCINIAGVYYEEGKEDGEPVGFLIKDTGSEPCFRLIEKKQLMDAILGSKERPISGKLTFVEKVR